jgi:hypothetical protein
MQSNFRWHLHSWHASVQTLGRDFNRADPRFARHRDLRRVLVGRHQDGPDLRRWGSAAHLYSDYGS